MALSQRLFVPRILWASFLMSVGIYGAMLVLIRNPGAAFQPSMLVALGVVAVSGAVASFVVPAAVYRSSLASASLPAIRHASGAAINSDNFASAGTNGPMFENVEDAVGFAVRVYQTPFILSLALSETVAITGFLAGFLGAPPSQFVPLLLGGAALIAVRFPTRDRVLGPVERRTGARLVGL